MNSSYYISSYYISCYYNFKLQTFYIFFDLGKTFSLTITKNQVTFKRINKGYTILKNKRQNGFQNYCSFKINIDLIDFADLEKIEIFFDEHGVFKNIFEVNTNLNKQQLLEHIKKYKNELDQKEQEQKIINDKNFQITMKKQLSNYFQEENTLYL